MKDIVFLGSKEVGYWCLSHLLENAGALGARVVAVLTNDRKIHSSDHPTVRDACDSFSGGAIPVLSSLEEYSTISDFDILLSVQYHQILKVPHIVKARQIAVNLHMAPLPEYRGCNQFSFAILDGAKEFGTTIHRLEKGIDSGAVMFERRFPIPENCRIRDLFDKTARESVALFKESIGKIVAGTYTLTSQKEYVGKRGTSFHLRNEIDNIKRIDLNWGEEKILRHFRATWFPPFPPPFVLEDGKKTDVTPEWIERRFGAGRRS